MAKLKVGIVGTSWWADTMYLPALKDYEFARIDAVCGRKKETLKNFAQKWQIEYSYTDYKKMIDSGLIEAIIIASSPESHFEIANYALDKNLAVLCEKPMTLNFEQATILAQKAKQKKLNTMVAFTYCFMPQYRYVRDLIQNNYIGIPYHMSIRYYAGVGRELDYNWRFDSRYNRGGTLADLGSHVLALASMIMGDIVDVKSQLGYAQNRAQVDDKANGYSIENDVAILSVKYANNAIGSLISSSVAYEHTAFNQTHQMEFHGSEGTLVIFNDWQNECVIKGSKAGEGFYKPLIVPDKYFEGINQKTNIVDIYKQVFRKTNSMARKFCKDTLEGNPSEFNFEFGAYIQNLIENTLKENS